jgi:hypothetical protein
MNPVLLNNIYAKIYSTISGLTTNIFFNHLPDQKLLNGYSCVYHLKNTGNENNLDGKEVIKQYSLIVSVQHPQQAKLQNESIYNLKGALYNLPSAYTTLTGEDLDFDENKKNWVLILAFSITA